MKVQVDLTFEEILAVVNRLSKEEKEILADRIGSDRGGVYAKENKEKIKHSDFSFEESRKALSHYKGSFSDAVIEERREDQ